MADFFLFFWGGGVGHFAHLPTFFPYVSTQPVYVMSYDFNDLYHVK